jgi:hypothetical protein
MQTKRIIAMVSASVLAATAPLVGHHAFSTEFDADKPIKLEGTVTKMEWVNPHAWMHIDVKKPDGTSEVWAIEGGTPNTLLRRGINRDSVKVGTVVLVDGYRAKDGSLKGNGRDLTLQNGQKLFMGSSGTGAPADGKDPTGR